MEVILVRHGIAEDKQLGKEDWKRHLTEEGKEEIQQLMSELKEKLEPVDGQNVVIWSSPANRALETAHIITSELEVENSYVKDFIYSGEFEKFSKELSTLDNDATVFVVGHQPSLGHWYTHLTGDIVKVKKGAHLSIDVQSVTPIVANSQWTIQP